ncbi:hypothetical protein [Fimbriiglobus ruber]|uniref:Uncharacterized protein n=1 Tax=Fimbriiglobus ruber TaxID=1908690 RepID=A0A225E8Z9_9BACT|nr:hypothetical protein [Fimbriiglobus ruber]OWK45085.1 hypothetical protein FRUB_01416 [Fimbriiglobus ruber]
MTTITVRCENESCLKWFEPTKLEAKPQPVDEDGWHTHVHSPTGNEAICPYCGTKQVVPLMDD